MIYLQCDVPYPIHLYPLQGHIIIIFNLLGFKGTIKRLVFINFEAHNVKHTHYSSFCSIEHIGMLDKVHVFLR